jgi:hypothetical protein
MNYYIITNENELQVIAVTPDRENAFIARYGGHVIVFADSIVETLTKFEELPVVITEFTLP